MVALIAHCPEVAVARVSLSRCHQELVCRQTFLRMGEVRVSVAIRNSKLTKLLTAQRLRAARQRAACGSLSRVAILARSSCQRTCLLIVLVTGRLSLDCIPIPVLGYFFIGDKPRKVQGVVLMGPPAKQKKRFDLRSPFPQSSCNIPGPNVRILPMATKGLLVCKGLGFPIVLAPSVF